MIRGTTDALQPSRRDIIRARLAKRRGVGDAGQGRNIKQPEQGKQFDFVAERKSGDMHRADTQNADESDSPDQQRNRSHRVQRAHQKLFEPTPAEEPGDQTQCHAAATADDNRDHRDLKRRAASPDHPAQDIAAGLVGAEQMCCVGWRQRIQHIDIQWIERRDPWRAKCVSDQQHHKAGPNKAARSAACRDNSADHARGRQHAWVQPGIGDIRRQIRQNEYEGENHDHSLHQSEIALLDRGQQRTRQTVDVEHGLDDQAQPNI
jgi:hypothetical protein